MGPYQQICPDPMLCFFHHYSISFISTSTDISHISVSTNENIQGIILEYNSPPCPSPFATFFGGLLGTESSYKSRSKEAFWGWFLRRSRVVLHSSCPRGGHYSFLRPHLVINILIKGWSRFILKVEMLFPCFISVFLYIAFPTFRSPLISNQCSHLNSTYPMRLRIQFALSVSQLQDEIWICFSAISFLWLQEAFRSFMQHLSWEFESLNSSISFSTLSSDISSKPPNPLYWLVWKKMFESFIYIVTDIL